MGHGGRNNPMTHVFNLYIELSALPPQGVAGEGFYILITFCTCETLPAVTLT